MYVRNVIRIVRIIYEISYLCTYFVYDTYFVLFTTYVLYISYIYMCIRVVLSYYFLKN